MLSLSLLALVGSAASMVAAQDLTSSHNVTSLLGTWSSGSGNVMTGLGFANPVNYSFTYPKTSGISYSFTDDGFFEEAQYRFTANASLPNCITAVVLWQHGTYTLGSNGSIVLNPWAADGRIQVQDPCAAVTNIITLYDQQVLYAGWGIQVDTIKGVQTLQLNRFDGALMPPLYLVARPPNMLPTTQLSGYIGNDTTLAKRGLSAEKRSAAAPSAAAFQWSLGAAGALAMAGLSLVL